MNHSFNVEIAEKYGLHEAIILENLYFWVKKNIANGQNYYDGNYWTYNSAKAFTELFPYMSNATIRRVLGRLESLGLVMTGNYNKVAYDRTKWYALTKSGFALFGDMPAAEPVGMSTICSNQQMQGQDLSNSICSPICSNQQMDLPKSANGIETLSKPIPDINTDINTDHNNIPVGSRSGSGSAIRNDYPKSFEAFWETYPRKDKKIEAYKLYQARLKDGYSAEELLTAARAYAEVCRKNRTVKQYIMQAKTFLSANLAFTDYLKKSVAAAPAESVAKKAPDDDEMEQFAQLLEFAT